MWPQAGEESSCLASSFVFDLVKLCNKPRDLPAALSRVQGHKYRRKLPFARCIHMRGSHHALVSVFANLKIPLLLV